MKNQLCQEDAQENTLENCMKNLPAKNTDFMFYTHCDGIPHASEGSLLWT